MHAKVISALLILSTTAPFTNTLAFAHNTSNEDPSLRTYTLALSDIALVVGIACLSGSHFINWSAQQTFEMTPNEAVEIVRLGEGENLAKAQLALHSYGNSRECLEAATFFTLTSGALFASSFAFGKKQISPNSQE